MNTVIAEFGEKAPMDDHRRRRRVSELQMVPGLLGFPETAPAHDDFGQIVDADGTVLLCLHAWAAHAHPTLMEIFLLEGF